MTDVQDIRVGDHLFRPTDLLSGGWEGKHKDDDGWSTANDYPVSMFLPHITELQERVERWRPIMQAMIVWWTWNKVPESIEEAIDEYFTAYPDAADELPLPDCPKCARMGRVVEVVESLYDSVISLPESLDNAVIKYRSGLTGTEDNDGN